MPHLHPFLGFQTLMMMATLKMEDLKVMDPKVMKTQALIIVKHQHTKVDFLVVSVKWIQFKKPNIKAFVSMTPNIKFQAPKKSKMKKLKSRELHLVLAKRQRLEQ
jgi:hypothetical protein